MNACADAKKADAKKDDAGLCRSNEKDA